MKATEQCFPVVLFIMLYKVVLTFESVDEILWCDHSNQSYRVVLSCRTLWCDQSNESYFPAVHDVSMKVQVSTTVILLAAKLYNTYWWWNIRRWYSVDSISIREFPLSFRHCFCFLIAKCPNYLEVARFWRGNRFAFQT